MKKILITLLAAIMAMTVIACGGTNQSTDNTSNQPSPSPQSSPQSSGTKKIGISMPTQSLQRWNQDGSNMKKQFEAAGYTVDLQYAGDNDIPTQVAQIENMISTNCDVLVIAAVDGSSLTEALKTAADKDIPVIAYDRLIMNSDAVAYYATFDNWKVGEFQGEYIRDMLKLDSEDGPFNIELFTGSPDDNNINFFFGGAMEVLQPYIDNGKLVVKSGQTSKAQCATANWSTEEAQKRMEDLISANGYGPGKTELHAVYSSNDSVANGITNALVAAGYTKENFPIITGQDCDKPAMKNMLAGIQSMSIFKDTRTLADRVVKMVNSIVEGTNVEVNDTETYDNGIKVVPSYLCEPVACTLDNYEQLLIDSGYYTQEDLK